MFLKDHLSVQVTFLEAYNVPQVVRLSVFLKELLLEEILTMAPLHHFLVRLWESFWMRQLLGKDIPAQNFDLDALLVMRIILDKMTSQKTLLLRMCHTLNF